MRVSIQVLPYEMHTVCVSIIMMIYHNTVLNYNDVQFEVFLYAIIA